MDGMGSDCSEREKEVSGEKKPRKGSEKKPFLKGGQRKKYLSKRRY